LKTARKSEGLVSLFARVNRSDNVVLGGKSLSPLGATRLEDKLPGFGAHTNTKAMLAFTLNIAWLKCTLHILKSHLPVLRSKKACYITFHRFSLSI